MIDRTTLLESMPTELWLGGLQVPASTGARFAVHDPATDAVLIEVADASPTDGARALDDAPDLLVVCLKIEDAASFQFLSMLQIDPATRHLPVLTYTTESEGQALPGVDDITPRRRVSGRTPSRLDRH